MDMVDCIYCQPVHLTNSYPYIISCEDLSDESQYQYLLLTMVALACWFTTKTWIIVEKSSIYRQRFRSAPPKILRSFTTNYLFQMSTNWTASSPFWLPGCLSPSQMVHAIMLHSGESTLPRTIFHPDDLVVLVWTCLSYFFLSRSWFSLALNLLFFSFVKTLTHTYTTTLPLSLLRTPIAFLRHPVRTRTPPRNPVTTRQPYRPQPLVPSSHETRDEVEQPPQDQLPLQTLSWLRWSAPNEPKSYDELPPVYNNCNLLIDDKNGILPRTHLQCLGRWADIRWHSLTFADIWSHFRTLTDI
jgi:hypothetical protein